MKSNSFSLNKFPKKVLENIISAKTRSVKNANSNKISILKKSLNSIFKEKFYGLAIDFDGTLIHIKKRTDCVDPYILDKLINLNKKKIPIFILTGRGKSILDQFPLNNFSFHKYILIAQYNGARIILGDKTLIFELNAKTFNEYETICQFLKENHRRIKDLQNRNHYIAIIRVVDIDQREDQSEPREDLSFIDNEIGLSVSPQDILQDLLNIFDNTQ